MAAVLGVEGRRHRLDEGNREGRCPHGCPGQLRRSGRDRDADPRRHVARPTSTTWSSASRWAEWASPDEVAALIRVARERRVLVLHRSRVRHLRRPRRLLMRARARHGGARVPGRIRAVKAVLEDGDEPVGYDLGDAMHRLELYPLAGGARAADARSRRHHRSRGAFARALDEHAITRVVHLAGLQVPFCRADLVPRPTGQRKSAPSTSSRRSRNGSTESPGSRLRKLGRRLRPENDPSPAPEKRRDRARPRSTVSTSSRTRGPRKATRQKIGSPVDRDPALCRLRTRPDQGMTDGADAGDGGSSPRRGLRDRLRRPSPGTTTRPQSPDAFVTRCPPRPRAQYVANHPGVAAPPWQRLSRRSRLRASRRPRGRSAGRKIPLPFPAEVEMRGCSSASLGPLPRTPLAEGVRRTVEHHRRVVQQRPEGVARDQEAALDELFAALERRGPRARPRRRRRSRPR